MCYKAIERSASPFRSHFHDNNTFLIVSFWKSQLETYSFYNNVSQLLAVPNMNVNPSQRYVLDLIIL